MVTWAPPDERGGNRQTEPTATAPHLDSTVSRMVVTSPGVALETRARLPQQLWRHGQVVLGGGNMHVTKIGCQLRQPALYVSAFAIPGDQPGSGIAVAKVMESWLIPRAILTTYVCAFTQLFEGRAGRSAATRPSLCCRSARTATSTRRRQ